MDFLYTYDPYIIIVYQSFEFLIYYNWSNDKQWIITGVCNLCGKCIEGAVNVDTRPYSQRLDIPISADMPSYFKECSLRGIELGN